VDLANRDLVEAVGVFEKTGRELRSGQSLTDRDVREVEFRLAKRHQAISRLLKPLETLIHGQLSGTECDIV
jgi:hypothetical protein